jgi:hypothetical protein
MRSWPVLGALAGAIVLLIAAVAIGRPYLSKQRDYPASIPQPPSVVSVELVRMKPKAVACLHDAVMDTHSERALFQVETYGKPTVPLRLNLDGQSYHATVHVAPSAYKDEGIVNVPVPGPRRDVVVRSCLTNVGKRTVALFATTTAEPGPVTGSLDGKALPSNPWLAFYEAKRTSIAHRLPTIVSRMAIFRPPFIGGWLLWPLALLFVFGVAAAVLVAYASALREDEARAVSAPTQRPRTRLARRSGSVSRQETDP